MSRRFVGPWGVAAAVLLSCMWFVVLPVSPSLAQADKEIRIGASLTLSGPYAELGKRNAVILKMLEEEVNASGGINGAKVRIVVADDGGSPAQAVDVLRRLANDEKVLAVAGPFTSSMCEAVFPVANQLGIVVASQSSSKPGVAAANRPWAFRNTIDEAVLAKVSVPYFKKAFHIKSVAIIYDAQEVNSVSFATKIMPALLKENSIEVLNQDNPITFKTGDLDLSEQVKALKALHPGGVVVAAVTGRAADVLKEMKRQDFIVPVIGGTTVISTVVLQAAPEIPIIAAATFYPTMEQPAAKAFVARAQPRLRKEPGLPRFIEPDMFDVNIYEIVKIYLDGVKSKRIKPIDDLAEARKKIRDHMIALKNFKGVVGPIRFQASGDVAKTFYIVRGQNGLWEIKKRGCSGDGGCGSS